MKVVFVPTDTESVGGHTGGVEVTLAHRMTYSGHPTHIFFLDS